ncbi:MAG: hypothetical protein IT557_08995 [Alphaproteobacteria bacterium]|nr:hypothetical protein [Alphaproteobacteria bacterium]
MTALRAFALAALILAGQLLGAGFPGLAAGAAAQELVRNGDFSQGGNPPSGWVIDPEAAPKGSVRIVDAGGGRRVLEVAPNSRNTPSAKPLGVGQAIQLGGMAGRTLHLSARIGLRGPATGAVVGLHALRANGSQIGFVHLRRTNPGEGLAPFEGRLEIPAGQPAQTLILIAVAEGLGGAALFDSISVRTTDAGARAASPTAAPPASAAGPDPAGGAPAASGARGASAPRIVRDTYTARVSVDASARLRTIPRDLYGVNIEWFRNANGLWDERGNRLEPRIVQFTRDLRTSLIRFPGGFLSDTYDWRQGIGPRERRPAVPSHPGTQERHKNNFGTEELQDFAAAVGANLLLTVNAGTGTPELAAEWVRYMTSGPGRRANGPRVTWWEVGNELYHKADFSGRSLPPEAYADRFLAYARAMRAVDPDIRLGAIGLENYPNFPFNDYPRWNEIVLRRAGQEMDFFAVHNAYAPGPPGNREDGRQLYEALLAAPLMFAENIRTTTEQIRRFAPANRQQRIRLAITEWGALFHVTPESPWIDHVKTLGSALFIADTMRVFVESERVDMATFFKLNEPGFVGLMAVRRGQWISNASYHALKIYTHHFGSQLVRSQVQGPTYDTRRIGVISGMRGVPMLSAVSSLSDDGQRLYVVLINKSLDRAAEVELDIAGASPGQGTAWLLTGSGPDAHTGAELPQIPGLRWAQQAQVAPWNRFRESGPDDVSFSGTPLASVGPRMRHRVPPHSLVSLELRLAR